MGFWSRFKKKVSSISKRGSAEGVLGSRKRDEPTKQASFSRVSPKAAPTPSAAPTPTADATEATAPQKNRLSRDSSGNYISEVGGEINTFTPKQWEELIDMKKVGGTKTGDPAVLAQFKREQEFKEMQNQEPTREITEFVSGSTAPWEAGSELEKTEPKFLGAVPDRFKAQAIEEGKKYLGPEGLLPNLPYIGGTFKTSMANQNFEERRAMTEAQRDANLAMAEFDDIVTDAQEGRTSAIQAQQRWMSATDKFISSYSTVKSISEENPIFFGDEGEDILVEWEIVRSLLPGYANVVNNALSYPGEGRRAITSDVGLPQ